MFTFEEQATAGYDNIQEAATVDMLPHGRRVRVSGCTRIHHVCLRKDYVFMYEPRYDMCSYPT